MAIRNRVKKQEHDNSMLNVFGKFAELHNHTAVFPRPKLKYQLAFFPETKYPRMGQGKVVEDNL